MTPKKNINKREKRKTKNIAHKKIEGI